VRTGLDSLTAAIGALGVLLAAALGGAAGYTAGVMAGVLAALAGLLSTAVLAVAIQRWARNVAHVKRRQEVQHRFAPPKPTGEGDDEQ
jgi:hypothetical protein